jgi:hypothetical protein
MRGDGNKKTITDIWRRVKVRSKIVNNLALLDKYDVQEGESPETVAYKAYGTTDYFWVVCLVNDIVNRYYDWPLDEYNFQQYVADKYTNPAGIHHYEKLQSSGHITAEGPADYDHYIEVNSDDPQAQSVSNIEYERRLQDKKRQIRLLSPQYLQAFEDEFQKLISK